MNRNSFDEAKERDVLKLMVQDECFYDYVADNLKHYYFNNEINSDIAKVINRFYELHGVVPTEFELSQSIKCYLYNVEIYNLDQYMEAVKYIYLPLLGQTESLKEDVVDFILTQDLRNALYDDVNDSEIQIIRAKFNNIKNCIKH